MQFGIFDHVDRKSEAADETPIHELYEERFRLVNAAEQAGFYCYHVAEHHLTRLGMAPIPSIYLAAVAQHTSTIKIGALVNLLPIYHPILMIEQIGMLDHLTHGRLQLGVGRGISPYEHAYFGVDEAETLEIFPEYLESLIDGLRGGMLNFDSKHVKIERAPIVIPAMQRPYPPLWQPMITPGSREMGAKFGSNLICAGPPEAVMAATSHYIEVWEEHKDAPHRQDSPVTDPMMGNWRYLCVADTDEEARKIAAEAFLVHMEHLNSLWKMWGGQAGIYMNDADLAMNLRIVVAGSPETVLEILQEDAERLGVNYMMFSVAYGNMTEVQSQRSLELFATKVMNNVA